MVPFSKEKGMLMVHILSYNIIIINNIMRYICREFVIIVNHVTAGNCISLDHDVDLK